MKKICFVLVSFFIIFRVFSSPFIDGQQYITLNEPILNDTQFLEFFSFFCSPCYQFEEVYHIGDSIRKAIPIGIKVKKYHVDFLGGELGPILTHAWAVAIALGVENYVLSPIFHAIHKNKIITDSIKLKYIFVKAANIKPEDYDAAWNSFAVKVLLNQQRKAGANMYLRGVPTIIINGKYMVNSIGLDSSSLDNFIKQYISVVKFLLEKQ